MSARVIMCELLLSMYIRTPLLLCDRSPFSMWILLLVKDKNKFVFYLYKIKINMAAIKGNKLNNISEKGESRFHVVIC